MRNWIRNSSVLREHWKYIIHKTTEIPQIGQRGVARYHVHCQETMLLLVMYECEVRVDALGAPVSADAEGLLAELDFSKTLVDLVLVVQDSDVRALVEAEHQPGVELPCPNLPHDNVDDFVRAVGDSVTDEPRPEGEICLWRRVHHREAAHRAAFALVLHAELDERLLADPVNTGM